MNAVFLKRIIQKRERESIVKQAGAGAKYPPSTAVTRSIGIGVRAGAREHPGDRRQLMYCELVLD